MNESFNSGGMLDMYLYESFQLLEDMEAIVLSEENKDFLDEESINEIFRIMHTIKGSSGIMMYDNITLLAHKLEDIFYYLRENYSETVSKIELEKHIFDVSDFISAELNKIQQGNIPDGNADSIVNEIDDFLSMWKTHMKEKGSELPPDNIYAGPDQYYIAPIAEAPIKRKIIINLDDDMDQDSIGSLENVVGVSEKKIDKLARLVFELVQIKDNNDVIMIKGALEELINELNHTVADIRKASLVSTFRRMHRIVHDASQKMDKSIDFIISGEELEIDRRIIDYIAEPLMHIIRNAADHGIEKKTERISAGKSEIGKIELDAKIDDNILFISIKDDGCGIDKKTIFYEAKQYGIVRAEEDINVYSDKDIYGFITYPGFTTKKRMTEYSGRGVGMDDVATKLQKIGGKLKINSRPGLGTEMIMEVPLR